MIAFVEGVLAEKFPSRAVVDVGGVGYGLMISLATYGDLPEEGGRVRLHALTYIRDDSIRLFGFSTREERELFRLLLVVPGVGPKLSLAILSALPADRFRRAVIEEDTALLTRIPGIGKKSAQRLVVELKSRFDKDGTGGADLPGFPVTGISEEARLALETLGFKADQAARAIEKALAGRRGDSPTVEQLVREALGGV